MIRGDVVDSGDGWVTVSYGHGRQVTAHTGEQGADLLLAAAGHALAVAARVA